MTESFKATTEYVVIRLTIAHKIQKEEQNIAMGYTTAYMRPHTVKYWRCDKGSTEVSALRQF
jgi:hypothetical protein